MEINDHFDQIVGGYEEAVRSFGDSTASALWVAQSCYKRDKGKTKRWWKPSTSKKEKGRFIVEDLGEYWIKYYWSVYDRL